MIASTRPLRRVFMVFRLMALAAIALAFSSYPWGSGSSGLPSTLSDQSAGFVFIAITLMGAFAWHLISRATAIALFLASRSRIRSAREATRARDARIVAQNKEDAANIAEDVDPSLHEHHVKATFTAWANSEFGPVPEGATQIDAHPAEYKIWSHASVIERASCTDVCREVVDDIATHMGHQGYVDPQEIRKAVASAAVCAHQLHAGYVAHVE